MQALPLTGTLVRRIISSVTRSIERAGFHQPSNRPKGTVLRPAKGECGGGTNPAKATLKHPTHCSRCPSSARQGDGHMHGQNLTLVTKQCRVCKRWFALHVDKDDLSRHLLDGIYVQHAFVRADGRPYLSPGERELFISAVGPCCWSV